MVDSERKYVVDGRALTAAELADEIKEAADAIGWQACYPSWAADMPWAAETMVGFADHLRMLCLAALDAHT